MKKRVLLFLICPSLEAMNGVIKPKTIPLCQETTWLVHQTNSFPENGLILPSAVPTESTTSDHGVPSQLTLDGMDQQNLKGFSVILASLHWTDNCLAYPHELPLSKNETTGTDHRYCIIEPLKAFNGKKLRGNSQDIFHLGSHTLSSQSIILVPAGDDSFKKKSRPLSWNY